MTDLMMKKLNEPELKELIQKSVNIKKELIKKNNLSLQPYSKKKKFTIYKPNIKSIIQELPISISIDPGNFCYPLTKNYLSIKEKNLFYRYFGEENIEEVTKKYNHIPSYMWNEFPDDLQTNLIFLTLLKKNNDIQEFHKKICNIFGNFSISLGSIIKRIRLLFDRLHWDIKECQTKFFHVSCEEKEEKNYENLFQTSKELLCPVCFMYDCHVHTLINTHFDSSQCYSIKDYLFSYKKMIETGIYYLNSNNIENDIFYKRLIQAATEFNSIIKNLKLFHSCKEIDFIKKENNIIKVNCCNLCYCDLLKIDDSTVTKFYNTFSKPLPIILELYLQKLIQILKFDPCSISKCMKMINIPEKNSIDCYIIFLRLLSSDYSITKVINKKYLEHFLKEKQEDKRRGMDTKRYRHINENVKNNLIIPYEPCSHLGNEICNEKCPCFQRGFCEKFCACNKQLCKLKYSGCRCRGPCNTSQCPCFHADRECDPDLCLSCREKGNVCVCKNMSLRKKTFKELGVGISSIIGWGLFAKEDFKKGDLIGEYVGEYIDNNILNERSEYIDLQGTTYLFTLNDDYTIDSRTMGNCLRFANHSKLNANAYSKIIFAGGNHRICLYASKDIKKDEEIFFDYDGQNLLCKKYNWINDGKEIRRNRRKNNNLYYDDEYEEDLPKFKARKTVVNAEPIFLNRKRKINNNNKFNNNNSSNISNNEEKFISSSENSNDNFIEINDSYFPKININNKDIKINNNSHDNEELEKIKEEVQNLIENISNEEKSDDDEENIKKEFDEKNIVSSSDHSSDDKFVKINIDKSQEEDEDEDKEMEETNNNQNISKIINTIKQKMIETEKKKI